MAQSQRRSGYDVNLPALTPELKTELSGLSLPEFASNFSFLAANYTKKDRKYYQSTYSDSLDSYFRLHFLQHHPPPSHQPFFVYFQTGL